MGGREGGSGEGRKGSEEEERMLKSQVYTYSLVYLMCLQLHVHLYTCMIPPNNIISSYPLSEVKNTSVLLATPFSLRSAMTLPTAQSRLASESPNGPLRVELVNSLEAN